MVMLWTGVCLFLAFAPFVTYAEGPICRQILDLDGGPAWFSVPKNLVGTSLDISILDRGVPGGAPNDIINLIDQINLHLTGLKLPPRLSLRVRSKQDAVAGFRYIQGGVRSESGKAPSQLLKESFPGLPIWAHEYGHVVLFENLIARFPDFEPYLNALMDVQNQIRMDRSNPTFAKYLAHSNQLEEVFRSKDPRAIAEWQAEFDRLDSEIDSLSSAYDAAKKPFLNSRAERLDQFSRPFQEFWARVFEELTLNCNGHASAFTGAPIEQDFAFLHDVSSYVPSRLGPFTSNHSSLGLAQTFFWQKIAQSPKFASNKWAVLPVVLEAILTTIGDEVENPNALKVSEMELN